MKIDRIKKELGQLFENRFNCYAEPLDDVKLAMSEEQFFNIASTIVGPINLNFADIADCDTSYYQGDEKIVCYSRAISKEKFVDVLIRLKNEAGKF